MSMICLHSESKKLSLQRGVRQDDHISPRLFTSCLQDAIIGKVNWKDRGIKIDGEYLSHLIFTDNIVLIAELTSELQKMLQDIHETSKPVGLNMHLGKTKVMWNPVVNKMDMHQWKEDQRSQQPHLPQTDSDKGSWSRSGVEIQNRPWLDCFWQAGLHYEKQKHTTEVENESAKWMTYSK